MNDAWLAGLFEGEGCIRIEQRKAGPRVRLIIVSTDKDVIARAKDIAGCGTIVAIKMDDGIRKDRWDYYCNRKEDVLGLINRLLPYMLSRRKGKMEEAKAVLEAQTIKPVGVNKHHSGRYYAKHRNKYLGMFDTADEAKITYEKARKEVG